MKKRTYHRFTFQIVTGGNRAGIYTYINAKFTNSCVMYMNLINIAACCLSLASDRFKLRLSKRTTKTDTDTVSGFFGY